MTQYLLDEVFAVAYVVGRVLAVRSLQKSARMRMAADVERSESGNLCKKLVAIAWLDCKCK
jgi:hypothetical protein